MIRKLIILKHYLLTKYFFQFKNRESLFAWQKKQLKKMLKANLVKSKFYKNLGIKNFEELPIIDKSIMMANFETINTVGLKKNEAFDLALKAENNRDFTQKLKNITIGLSSGTSGNRGIFLVDEKETLKWVGTILAKTLPSSILKKHKIAFFLRANSNLYKAVNSKNIKFLFFDLLQPVKEHFENLNKFGPSILVAPPSMLRILAKAKEDNNLSINPSKIISVAEVLDPLDEKFITKHFKKKIHQIYQATEGFLGTTCKHGTFHLNEDLIYFEKEYLDAEHKKFIPIITDLFRDTQPIIRYRLNDILTEKKELCPCGSVFTAIEKIEGRCDDIFYLKSINGEKLVQIFPDFISRAIIFSSTEILSYKVRQIDFDKIEIFLEIESYSNMKTNMKNFIEEEISKALCNLFVKVNCQIPIINYIYETTKIFKDKKLKRIERDFFI